QDHAEQAGLMRLYAATGRTLRVLAPAVYASNPASLAAATAEGPGDGPGNRQRFGLLERRRLRAQARSLWLAADRPPWTELHAALTAAAAELAEWQQLSDGEPGTPRLPSGYGPLAQLHTETERQLAALRAFVPALPADGSPDRPVERMVRALAADQDTPWQLPRLYELALRFDQMGLRPLLDEMARREADGDLAAAAFDHPWDSSILHHT